VYPRGFLQWAGQAQIRNRRILVTERAIFGSIAPPQSSMGVLVVWLPLCKIPEYTQLRADSEGGWVKVTVGGECKMPSVLDYTPSLGAPQIK